MHRLYVVSFLIIFTRLMVVLWVIKNLTITKRKPVKSLQPMYFVVIYLERVPQALTSKKAPFIISNVSNQAGVC